MAAQGCAASVVAWVDPPPPALEHGHLDETSKLRLTIIAKEALHNARRQAEAGQRVVWFARAGIAQYQLQRGGYPVESELLRDDPTGVVSQDVVAEANEQQRRHHPHLFDATSRFDRLDAPQRTRTARAWAAHCAFRIAELDNFVFRQVHLPVAFDGTFVRRVKAKNDALDRALHASMRAAEMARGARDARLEIAILARTVMMHAELSAAIVGVGMSAAYSEAPDVAAELKKRQLEIALPLAARARRLLVRLNKIATSLRRADDPWVAAARKAVLAVPRRSL